VETENKGIEMKHHTVLVVEDNPMNMKLVKDLLHLGKYNVLEACDAKIGIQLSREHRPDLILMDIQLPGMDGLTATRHIRQDSDLKDTPVIALTAHAMLGDDKKAGEAGCDGYISKPIDTRNFLKQVEQFIEIKSNKMKSSTRTGTHHKNRILIIDNDPLNTKLLVAKLPAHKYKTKIISSWTEIMEVIRSNMEVIIKEYPDLILMDVMMAEIDSCELTSRLKNNSGTKHIPIIIITPIDGKDSKAKALEAGADEIINKPVDSIELTSRTSSVIRLKQCEEQLAIHNEAEELMSARLNKERSVQEVMVSHSVLLIGDIKQDVKLIQSYLKGQSYRVSHVNSCNEAISLAQQKKIDLFILDDILSDSNGFEACRLLKSKNKTKNIPAIVITGVQDLENMSEVIELGFDDYLIKPINSQELQARINLLLKKKKSIEYLQSTEAADVHSSIYDAVTGLHSYIYFKNFLELEVKKSLSHNYPVSLTIISVDNIQHSNDMSGLSSGEGLILELAQIIKSNVRETDLAARFSENEFALILPYYDKNTTLSVVERIRQVAASHSVNHEDTSPQGEITLSIGIASCAYDAPTSAELIQNAKNMLDKAQIKGRNRVCAYG
jgi:two-component system cell cycle response regulator